MTRLIADASAIVDLLSGTSRAGAIRSELSAIAELDVPEHFHVEAISALRVCSAAVTSRADRALDARVLTTDRGLEAAARSDRRLVEL